MKALFIISLAFIFAVQLCHAQRKYSMENLESSSEEQVNFYLQKATNLQMTGRSLNIIGGISYGAVAASALLGSDAGFGLDSWALIGIATGGLIIGTAAFAVGIPTNLIGRHRVSKINSLKASSYNGLAFKLSPCLQYNLNNMQYQPGLSLRINF